MMRHCDTEVIAIRMEPPPRSVGPPSAPPSVLLEDRRDAPLLGGADVLLREAERVHRDTKDGSFAAAGQVLGDQLLPHIALEAGILLWGHVLGLEVRIGPPLLAPPVANESTYPLDKAPEKEVVALVA
jgi:hypothetical protein